METEIDRDAEVYSLSARLADVLNDVVDLFQG
jgi:hypothetical protein